MKKTVIFSFFLLILYACGGKEEQTTPQAKKEKVVETVDHIIIQAFDNMTYDKTKFTVKAGQEIVLTLANRGTMPIEAMGHNVVILHLDVDVSEFANVAAKAVDTDYIPKDKEDDIIAHTKLLGPGEGNQIKFTLEEAGVYDFICTFPAHSVTMKGKITAI